MIATLREHPRKYGFDTERIERLRRAAFGKPDPIANLTLREEIQELYGINIRMIRALKQALGVPILDAPPPFPVHPSRNA
ncbi:MAG: hypothetical protein VB050_00790 [Geobacteraceae bacterium]|nr:hypothetical protein [Geobacteraceae bacterium]